MNKLLSLFNQNNFKIYNSVIESKLFVFEFDVHAKPGAKKELIEIDHEGKLILKINAKPIDGEANESIREKISEIFGTSKSNVQIIRGEKSKIKRIKTQLEITANKNENYYLEKFTLISKQLI